MLVNENASPTHPQKKGLTLSTICSLKPLHCTGMLQIIKFGYVIQRASSGPEMPNLMLSETSQLNEVLEDPRCEWSHLGGHVFSEWSRLQRTAMEHLRSACSALPPSLNPS